MTTLILVWIFFGLLNFYTMKRADGVSGDNPPHGVYWVRGRECFSLFASFVSGPIVLPFTVWAFRDWRRLSRVRIDMVDKSTSTER
ncbi:MAG: hypothetical protein A2655_01630 [Candidatus Yanofskybacteria bacterium RIFCSPHIGHO2_01_FULL_43_42]|uniref:Uncharacterized protein n=1 Tax=Candidatus Yanofskybacteria bacterium RIFCSPLOWO2_01_FULL_43_22 TaxID=1802695 RepID=A0A1F8GGT0_9BACT|nr:MAG: hypothetical protein A2655_01630 [Candidatus Yanofskybacteria bacterium RIFCSPHIGHO2_01_FULL_43_42]OGN13179.1 MAG: hypothetical protein A3D48_02535 [Candidatus Yanofskybacteria bacterium RIFCSPHIGHO2_02_FULL_43_17]OGN24594.1 MAG: hypothetical protein A3A13_00760 [Candidatus Yanofskybacteria bacterium RIFCSPLOWO2_01_FULL_43_22]